MNSNYLRMLTIEEKQKLNLVDLEVHDYASARREKTPEEVATLESDIKDYGILDPIELLDGKIINGDTRVQIAIGLDIPIEKIPFAEYIGPKDEEFIMAWINKQYQQGQDDTTAKIIRLVEHVCDTLLNMRKTGDWKTHNLYCKGMSFNDLLGAVLKLSPANVKKGKQFKNGVDDETKNGDIYRELLNSMKLGCIEFEDAYRLLFISPYEWVKDDMSDKAKKERLKWIDKMLKVITEKKKINQLEIARGKLLMLPDEEPSTQFQDAPAENVKAKGKLVVQMDKIQSESAIEFKQRAKGFTKALTTLANQWGITDVHVITGSVGKMLIDEALNKTLEIEGALIETVAIEKQQAKAISDELANSPAEKIAPDKSAEKKYRQYIGKRK